MNLAKSERENLHDTAALRALAEGEALFHYEVRKTSKFEFNE